MTSCRLLGLRFSDHDSRSLANELINSITATSSKPAKTVIFVNPHSIVASKANPVFKDAIDTCSFLVNDGVGISIMSRLFCRWAPPRVPGYDGFLTLLSGMDEASSESKKFRLGFFGASESTLEKIKRRVALEHPNLAVVVSISPPFGDWTQDTNDMFIARINEAKVDVLFVGMTAPKQEIWAHTYGSKLDVRCILSIGAVFDFYAGTINRPHRALGAYGFEWLGRLIAEPRRLWRRTFISAPLFVWYCAQYHLLRKG